MRTVISDLLMFALLAALGYGVWRAIRAARHRPVGARHLRWIVLGGLCSGLVILIALIAPPDPAKKSDTSSAERAPARTQAHATTSSVASTENAPGSATAATPVRRARRRRAAPRRPSPATPKRGRAPALTARARLPVKGRAPLTGYERAAFGDGWLSVNGCDMRDRILRRDVRRKTFLADGARCEVLSGRLADPYTATTVIFQRGGSVDVDIDHVVALGDAWQKGAQQWAYPKRVAFANDPLNLLAVDASANRQKGDGDAATWLPGNKAFRCPYVARQIAVKRKYGAWLTRAEHDAMHRVLSRCPHQPLPARGTRTPVITAARPRPHTAPSPGSASSGRAFENCDAVRAAGQTPLRRGTAVYSANSSLDRDGDGLACE